MYSFLFPVLQCSSHDVNLLRPFLHPHLFWNEISSFSGFILLWWTQVRSCDALWKLCATTGYFASTPRVPLFGLLPHFASFPAWGQHSFLHSWRKLLMAWHHAGWPSYRGQNFTCVSQHLALSDSCDTLNKTLKCTWFAVKPWFAGGLGQNSSLSLKTYRFWNCASQSHLARQIIWTCSTTISPTAALERDCEWSFQRRVATFLRSFGEKTSCVISFPDRAASFLSSCFFNHCHKWGGVCKTFAGHVLWSWNHAPPKL